MHSPCKNVNIPIWGKRIAQLQTKLLSARLTRIITHIIVTRYTSHVSLLLTIF